MFELTNIKTTKEQKKKIESLVNKLLSLDTTNGILSINIAKYCVSNDTLNTEFKTDIFVEIEPFTSLSEKAEEFIFDSTEGNEELKINFYMEPTSPEFPRSIEIWRR